MSSEIERDLFFPLLYGPRGVKWLLLDEPIEEGNPLMFTCSFCRKTSGSYPYNSDEKIHEDKCRNMLMNKLGM